MAKGELRGQLTEAASSVVARFRGLLAVIRVCEGEG